MNINIDKPLLYKTILSELCNGTIQDVMDSVYRFTQVPILAVDISYNVLGIAPQMKTGDHCWDYLLEHRGFDLDHAIRQYQNGTMQSVANNTAPYIIDWDENADYPKILGLIEVNHNVEGYVTMQCLPEELNPETSQLLLEIMEVVQQGCSVLYKRTGAENSMDQAVLKTFTAALFNKKFKSEVQLNRWYETTGIRIDGNYRLLAIRAQEMHAYNILSFTGKKLKNELQPCLTITINNILYCIMYELRDSSASRASQLLKILKPMKARCGISETFDNLIHLDAYRFQAESALNLGREKHPEEWIYHYRDYFLPSLLNPRLMEFADSLYIPPAIRTLRDYDAEHHTELSATLEMYINELCRTSSTAQKLHIHRNSLLYRLQKIEEIANISLKDFHTVLLLGISYHLQKELMP